MVSPLIFPPGIAGDAGLGGPAGRPGDRTEAFGGTAVGVTVPDAPGEPAVGSEVVDWKSVERDAFERRYGRLLIEARGDLAGLDGRPLETSRFVSESESCGVCSGSSGVDVMGRVRCYPARQSGGWCGCSGHLYPEVEQRRVGECDVCWGCVGVY